MHHIMNEALDHHLSPNREVFVYLALCVLVLCIEGEADCAGVESAIVCFLLEGRAILKTFANPRLRED
jgi:hypothetical protein